MTESIRCTRCSAVKLDDPYNLCPKCRKRLRDQYHKYRKAKETGRYQWMIKLKESTLCTDCGGHRSHKHMHWDHLPGFEKVDTISDMIRKNASRDLIEAELAKCELVCDRCHHRRGRERGQHKPVPRTGQEIPCEVCQKLVYRTQSYLKAHKRIFCSEKCMGLGNRTKLRIHYWSPPQPPEPPKRYAAETIRRAKGLGIPLPDGSDPNVAVPR